jgi:hypothetical protein
MYYIFHYLSITGSCSFLYCSSLKQQSTYSVLLKITKMQHIPIVFGQKCNKRCLNLVSCEIHFFKVSTINYLDSSRGFKTDSIFGCLNLVSCECAAFLLFLATHYRWTAVSVSYSTVRDIP